MKTPIDETWYTRLPGIPERISSGGVVCRLEDDRVLVALVREEDYPLFVLPKGGVEEGESLTQAARREIHEEAGLTQLTLIRKLGVLERLAYGKHVWQVTHFFLFATHQKEGAPADALRHFGVWWHPIDDLPEMLWPGQRRFLEAHRTAIADEI